MPLDPLAMPNQKALSRYDWRSGLGEQSGIINAMGEDALTNARQAAQRRVAQEAADREKQLNDAAIAGANLNQNAFAAAGAKGEAGSGFQKFMSAISKQESGGNYNALNKMSGAMGKYQIMPSNILGTKRGWDWE